MTAAASSSRSETRPQEQAKPGRLVFTGKQQVTFEAFDPGQPGPGQVRTRAICSLMSTGTENIVLNRLFEPGSHWDRWVKYPFHPGYSMIGAVETVGAGVTGLKVGDIVAMRYPHASHRVLAASECVVVPPTLDPRLAAWFALGKITFMGARAAEYQIGDVVVIIGAGPIGQMSVRWAAALGCQRIIVVDQVESRLALARAGGATTTIAKPIGEAREAIIAANRGEQPCVVIDGTGNQEVFVHALGLVARKGTVVILGDTGSPSQQRLTSDVITRGVRIVGAHDCLEDAQWNTSTITEYFFVLAASGRFPLAGMNSHSFPGAEGMKAYELANTRRGETMGIIFDWAGG